MISIRNIKLVCKPGIIHRVFFRTITDCGILCHDDAKCHGYKWDETAHSCTLMEKEGICLDNDSTDPVKLIVGESEVCGLLCQGIHDKS